MVRFASLASVNKVLKVLKNVRKLLNSLEFAASSVFGDAGIASGPEVLQGLGKFEIQKNLNLTLRLVTYGQTGGW